MTFRPGSRRSPAPPLPAPPDSKDRSFEGTRGLEGTRVVGVLGGIASGKSHVARVLAGPDGQVVAADALAHRVLEDPLLAPRLVEAFGPAALDAEGRPDREVLARAVFEDAERRRLLESWIHPAVRAMIARELRAAALGRVPLVVLDVPLLLENDHEHHLVAECDALVFVDAPLADRERRARDQRGWPPGELTRREAAQLPLDAKARRATHVLSNAGSAADLEANALALRRRLLALPPRRTPR